MVDYREQRLDDIFHALSDETRRAILARLAGGECSVTELAAPFRMSLAAVSKHLKVLEDADLVRKEKNGRTFRCRPHFEPLNEANQLLEQFAVFWQGRLTVLENFLTADSIKDDSSNGEKNNESSRKSGSPEARNTKSHPRKKRKGV